MGHNKVILDKCKGKLEKALLDNFDSICASLNIGLPAEIEARHKQYDYYRDKLLNFRRNKNE